VTEASTIIRNDVTYDKCPLCQGDLDFVGSISNTGTVFFSSHLIKLERTPELNRCRKCKSGITQNAITPDVALELYSHGKGSERWQSSKAFDQLKTSIVVDRLKEYFLQGKRVLDVGCNTGELLDIAKARGCLTFGVEPSDDGRLIAQRKKHHVVSSMHQLDGAFDVITAFDLIEHVYDVNHTIHEFCRYLSPGGTIILLTGDIECRAAARQGSEWWYVQFPEHVVFPSRTYFKSLTEIGLVEIVPTFAERRLEPRIIRRAYNVVKGRFLANYPDHILVILQAKKKTPHNPRDL
jgi:2-polyprenyl-3-methyl-5-hydroxy-6-metoxy-1,4-benzoquinol methylase